MILAVVAGITLAGPAGGQDDPPPTTEAPDTGSPSTTTQTGPVIDLSPQLGELDDLETGDEPADSTTTTMIECGSFGEVITNAEAIFIGTITGINENANAITYRVDTRESGGIQNPVTVFYVDDRPALSLGDKARVRVTYSSDAQVLSNITCGATTTLDDEFLEAAVDPLSAIGKSSAKVARRVGRYLLIGGLVVLAATAVATFIRRMWPLVF
ncbi:MAG: hypothetical protein HKN26_04730 [Acidimicrobiales bacterium]|nr:hypothetical protein [Acidimicrobiales bacterium]